MYENWDPCRFHENWTNLHFDLFSVINHLMHHAWISSRSLWSRRWSSKETILRYRTQSSAKRRMLEEILPGMSLIKIRKSRGPRTEPWGTPEVTSAREDEELLFVVNWVREEKKSRIQERMRGSIPWHESLASGQRGRKPSKSPKIGHQFGGWIQNWCITRGWILRAASHKTVPYQTVLLVVKDVISLKMRYNIWVDNML